MREMIKNLPNVSNTQITYIDIDDFQTSILGATIDGNIIIWEKICDNWKISSNFKAHDGSILKALWSSKCFGDIIATCSYGCSVRIWKKDNEIIAADKNDDSMNKWKNVHTIKNKDFPPNNIIFAPKVYGFILITTSPQGLIKLYESNVIDPSTWKLKTCIKLTRGIVSISWGYSRKCGSCLAVGFNEAVSVNLNKENESFIKNLIKYLEVIEIDETLTTWKNLDIGNRINCLAPVLDVAFSPCYLNDYHLLALATNSIRLFKIQSRKEISEFSVIVHEILHHKNHISEISHLSWNFEGNILSAISRDGHISCHKEINQNEFSCVFESNPKENSLKYFSRRSDYLEERIENDESFPSHFPIFLWENKIQNYL